MFYTGLVATFTLIISFFWLLYSFFTTQPKRFPLILFASASFFLFLSFAIVPKAPSTFSDESTVKKQVTELSDKAQTKLSDLFTKYHNEETAHAKAASISFYPDGQIRHIQLDVSDKWYTLTATEKANYLTFLEKIGQAFSDNKRLPFLQIHSEQQVVARSGAQNSVSFHIFK